MNFEKLARHVTRKHWEHAARTTLRGRIYTVKAVLWRHWGGLAWSYTINQPDLSRPTTPRNVVASRLYLDRHQARHDATIEVGSIMDALYDASLTP